MARIECVEDQYFNAHKFAASSYLYKDKLLSLINILVYLQYFQIFHLSFYFCLFNRLQLFVFCNSMEVLPICHLR